MNLIINEGSFTLDGLIADFIAGGIGALQSFGKGDALVPVQIRTAQRSASGIRLFDDTWVSGDVLTIGIGDGINAPVCVGTITTSLTAAAVNVANVSYAAGPPATLATSTITFTDGTYGGFYSITATANSVTTACGNISPLASPAQILAVLENNAQINGTNCSITQVGQTIVIQWTGNLTGTSPTLAVTNVSLLAPVGASGTLGINTSGMNALFVATTANQIPLEFSVMRTRGGATKNIYHSPVTILRSVIDPSNVIPTPPLTVANITRITNLTTDGVMFTSGGIGTLNVIPNGAGVLQNDGIGNFSWVAASGTITAGTTPTSGYSAGDIVISDGTYAQPLTPGTGVSVAIANAVNAASGFAVLDGGGNLQAPGTSFSLGNFVFTVIGDALIIGTNTGDQTFPAGNLAFVDTVNGNDSTGTVGRQDKPYLTDTAVQTAASPGDCVKIRPGSYSGALGKDGVVFDLDSGVVLTNVNTNNSTLGDVTAAMTTAVFGSGILTKQANSGIYHAVVQASNAATVMTVQCRGISATATAGGTKSVLGTNCVAGSLYVDVLESITATSDQATNCYSVYWTDGNSFVRAPLMSSTGSVYWSNGNNAGNSFISGDLLTSTTGNQKGVIMDMAQSSVPSWVRAAVIQSVSGNTSAVQVGDLAGTAFNLGGKLYADFQKAFGRMANDSGTANALLYVNYSKIEAVANGTTLLPGLLLLNSGINRIAPHHWNTNSFTGNMFVISGGTNYIDGGDYTANASSKGFEISGGTTYIRNMVIDTSANSGVSAFNISGGTVYLVNCQIKSNAGGYDILQTGGTVNVTNGSGSGTNGAFTTSGTVGFTKAPTALLADSATTLATTRTIGGSNFNGSANVTSFPAPGAIGGTTPSTGAFTTLSATGQITSTLAIGTAPLVITSTTLVSNLYVARAALADSATTNANLTGPITSVGNATSVASQTGTGSKFVMDTGPTVSSPSVTGTISMTGSPVIKMDDGVSDFFRLIPNAFGATFYSGNSGTGTQQIAAYTYTAVADTSAISVSAAMLPTKFALNQSGGQINIQAPDTLTGTYTAKFTNVSGNVVTTGDSATVTNAMLAGSIVASKMVGTDIATVGTLTAGATGAGFTVALSTSTITGTLADARLSSNVPLKAASNTFTGTQTIQAAATQDAIAIAGRAGGTSSYVATIVPPTLAASITITTPAVTSTLATLAGTETFSNKTLTAPVVAVLKPASDATTAIQFTKADGSTNVLNIDTTNLRIGVKTTSPGTTAEIRGAWVTNKGQFYINADSGSSFGGFACTINASTSGGLMYYQSSDSTFQISTGGTSDIVFSPGNTESCRFKTTGIVVTGTASVSSLTASKPVFTNASKVIVSGSYAVPQIIASADLLAQSAAVTSVAAYTTPNDSTVHSFRVGGYASITAISAGTLTVQVTFTDENNTAQTISYFAMGLTSAGLTATGFTAFSAAFIRCYPNTAITFKTTFTGVSITYDVGCTMESLY